ncbi:MAG: 50S ribosomal protein L10 [Alphaproteobacteria bacterium]
MDRSLKQAEIDDLRTVLEKQYSVIVYRPKGLTVAEDRALRQKMHAANADMRVIKNTLAKRAVDGTKFAGLSDFFKGPTGLAYSADPVAPAKVIADYAKGNNNKVEIIGGVLGEQTLDATAASALAKLPSLNELRARIVGMLQTPATRLAVVLKEPAGKLARIMAAKAKQ